MKKIMVQMTDKAWTIEALHLACAMAHGGDTPITLVRFMEVGHPSYLGTDMGYITPTAQEYRDLQDYRDTAEDYGVTLEVRSMQCLSPLDALTQAASELEADVVFAHVAETAIPYWRRLRLWNLRRELSGQGCQLYTLDKPAHADEWVPAVTVKA
jgi:nucleotide-binding universal stress UspA family protein